MILKIVTKKTITHPAFFAEGKFCHTSRGGRLKLERLRREKRAGDQWSPLQWIKVHVAPCNISLHYDGYGKVIGDPASQARRFCSAHSATQNFDTAKIRRIFGCPQDASSPKRALWAMKRGREGNKQGVSQPSGRETTMFMTEHIDLYK